MGDPLQLPIRQYTKEIVDSVKANPVTVVIGETGSGKTTQISQILLEAGFTDDGGMIGITQPRRVAAVMVARRVAQERNTNIGDQVGYAVRFEDRSSRNTRIKYLTDGTLLRELLQNPSLDRYSVLVLDEAHERSLNTDILFALLKSLATGTNTQRTRPLKLVVTSATLESEKFSAYFNNCPVFRVPGRTFPVDIIHSVEDHTKDYALAVVDTALDIHCNQPEGDILIFLTGQAEIDKAVKELRSAVTQLPPGTCGDLLVMPLYASLPPDMQARIFNKPPPGVRRCVVATNIAETSVTVDGVVYVIDPGVVKQKDYNPSTGMDSLSVVSISRVQATQRAGRAGRTRPGTCFRLYSKKTFERDMPNITAPEIQRTSLVGAVLYLKSLPMMIDVLGFDYLDAPSRTSLEDALRQLYVLDAIDIDGNITALGKKMSTLPLDPSLARALLAAEELGCVQEMMTVAAMVSGESSVFLGNKGPEQLVLNGDGLISDDGRELLEELMRDGLGDHILLLKLYQAWIQAGQSNDWCLALGVDQRSLKFAKEIRQQLERIIVVVAKDDDNNDKTERSSKRAKTDVFSSPDTIKKVRKALAIGFANRLAHRMPLHNGYRTLGASPALAQLHPSCAKLDADDDGLLPEWLVYHELMSTGRTYLSKVCPVKASWIKNILPKLQNVDVMRLSGGKTSQQVIVQGEALKQQVENKVKATERRNADEAVDAARARYLARKAAAAAASGGSKRGGTKR